MRVWRARRAATQRRWQRESHNGDDRTHEICDDAAVRHAAAVLRASCRTACRMQRRDRSRLQPRSAAPCCTSSVRLHRASSRGASTAALAEGRVLVVDGAAGRARAGSVRLRTNRSDRRALLPRRYRARHGSGRAPAGQPRLSSRSITRPVARLSFVELLHQRQRAARSRPPISSKSFGDSLPIARSNSSSLIDRSTSAFSRSSAARARSDESARGTLRRPAPQRRQHAVERRPRPRRRRRWSRLMRIRCSGVARRDRTTATVAATSDASTKKCQGRKPRRSAPVGFARVEDRPAAARRARA